MNELIRNLLAAMKDRVSNLEWMGGTTKVQAQKSYRHLRERSARRKLRGLQRA